MSTHLIKESDMSKAKYHLEIESERLAQQTWDTYFLMGVHTMPDGEVIRADLVRETDLAKIREIAKQQAQTFGCRVVEAL
jgi:hypothetical protein